MKKRFVDGCMSIIESNNKNLSNLQKIGTRAFHTNNLINVENYNAIAKITNLVKINFNKLKGSV